jgi:signal transduction histidine kinase
LILVYVTPVVLIELVLVAFFYVLAKDALDREMGRRLIAIAESAAAQVPPEAVLTSTPGGEPGPAHVAVREKLARFAARSDVARVYVFDRDGRSLVDSTGIPVGTRYHKLASDLLELEQVGSGNSAASTLFTGPDGRLYKSGYAPLRVGDAVVATVGVDASVTFFATIRQVRDRLLLFGAATILVLVAISVGFARRIERPLGELVRSARRIGEGDLAEPIAGATSDEIGFLAGTMEEMRRKIVENTTNLMMLQRGIAHEVRNPLGGMALFADLLLDELDEEPQRAHVRKIQKELASLNKVVSAFLDYTRPIAPEVRETEVESLLQNALGLVSREMLARDVRCETRLDPALPRLRVDPDLLQGVLINVLTNACQAMPGGGTVTIATRRDGGVARITVDDTGPGIPEDGRESVFRPFYTTKERGTGLGLAFARKIVEAHGGAIRAEAGPGGGARLAIELPLGAEG